MSVYVTLAERDDSEDMEAKTELQMHSPFLAHKAQRWAANLLAEVWVPVWSACCCWWCTSSASRFPSDSGTRQPPTPLSRYRASTLRTLRRSKHKRLRLVWTSECEWHPVSETIKIHKWKSKSGLTFELVGESYREDFWKGSMQHKKIDCCHSLFVVQSALATRKNWWSCESWSRGACWLGSIIAGGSELLGTPTCLHCNPIPAICTKFRVNKKHLVKNSIVEQIALHQRATGVQVAELPKTAPIYPMQPMHSNSRLSRPVQPVPQYSSRWWGDRNTKKHVCMLCMLEEVVWLRFCSVLISSKS